MSDPVFNKEQVAALEKILGVKLPSGGFTLEIKPLGQLDDSQLDSVVGGSGGTTSPAPTPAPTPAPAPTLPSGMRWMVKI